MDVRNILTGSFYQRPTGPDLPPQEEKNRGYSKDGVFLEPGARVRDKWGYLGTVVRYNKNGWVNVYFKRDIDDKVFSKGTQHLTTVSDEDDQSPWLYSPKVPEGKRPSNWEEMVSAEQKAKIDAEVAAQEAELKEVKKAKWKASQAEKKATSTPAPAPEDAAKAEFVPDTDKPLSIQDIADAIALNNSSVEEMRGALGAYAKSENLTPADIARLSRMLGLDDDGDGGGGGVPPAPAGPEGDGGGDLPKAEAPSGADEATEDAARPVEDIEGFKKELGKAYDEALGDATNDQNALLLRSYQEEQDVFMALNAWLRGRKSLSKIEEEFEIDRSYLLATREAISEEINAVPALQNAIILYRGTRMKTAEELFALEVGETYVDKGFVSTSLDRETAEEFTRIHLEEGADPSLHGVVVEIVAPKGTKAISLAAYFGDEIDAESEMLLARDQRYVVLSKTEATDTKPRTIRVAIVNEAESKAEEKAVTAGSRPWLTWEKGASAFSSNQYSSVNRGEFFLRADTTKEELQKAIEDDLNIVFEDENGNLFVANITSLRYFDGDFGGAKGWVLNSNNIWQSTPEGEGYGMALQRVPDQFRGASISLSDVYPAKETDLDLSWEEDMTAAVAKSDFDSVRDSVMSEIKRLLRSREPEKAANLAARFVAALYKAAETDSELSRYVSTTFAMLFGNNYSGDLTSALGRGTNGMGWSTITDLMNGYYSAFRKDFENVIPDGIEKIRIGSQGLVLGTGAPDVTPAAPLSIGESAFEKVESLISAVKRMLRRKSKDDDNVFASAAVDSGDIEDFEVRAMTVVKQSTGEKSLRVKYKLTAWAGKSLAAKILEAEEATSRWDLYPFKISYSSRTSSGDILIEDTKGPLYETYGGVKDGAVTYTMRLDLPSGKVATIEFHRVDDSASGLSNYNGTGHRRPVAFNNTVTIDLPVDASQEDIEYAMKNAGVSQVRAASPEDLRILAENRLLSVFGRKTNASVNVADQDERKRQLEEIKKRWGVEPEDIEIAVDATGALTFKVPAEVALRISATTNTHALRHSISTDGLTDYLIRIGVLDYVSQRPERHAALAKFIVDILLTGGLRSTERRYTEGVPANGMSSIADIETGGASYVYLSPLDFNRIEHKTQSSGNNYFGIDLLFDPDLAYQRIDFYANSSDAFGERFDEIDVIEEAHSGAYEVMFKHGLGTDALMALHVSREAQKAILKELEDRGIKEINGIPIENFVVTTFTKSGSRESVQEIARLQALVEEINNMFRIDRIEFEDDGFMGVVYWSAMKVSGIEVIMNSINELNPYSKIRADRLWNLPNDAAIVAIDGSGNVLYETAKKDGSGLTEYRIFSLTLENPEGYEDDAVASSLAPSTTLEAFIKQYPEFGQKIRDGFYKGDKELELHPMTQKGFDGNAFVPVGMVTTLRQLEDSLSMLVDKYLASGNDVTKAQDIAGFLIQLMFAKVDESSRALSANRIIELISDKLGALSEVEVNKIMALLFIYADDSEPF